MTRWKLYQVRNLKDGLCRSCPRKAVPGTARCRAHAAYNRAAVRAWKLRRKGRGEP
jgi:hypothetical protein